jgi:hypothetical protein
VILVVIEVPFSAFFVALVTAVPVGFAGMGRRWKCDDGRKEEGKIQFHFISLSYSRIGVNGRGIPHFFLTSPGRDVTLPIAVAGKNMGL